MKILTNLSLSRQFLVASFPILLLGIAAIGAWVGHEVEEGVVNRIGGVAGLYVESFLAPYVQTLAFADDLTEQDRRGLDRLMSKTRLGERIVSFKVWRRDGRVLYSKDASIIGRTFPAGRGLVAGFAGNVYSQVSGLSSAENEYEAKRWTRLFETYVPIHAEGSGEVVAVAEFYQTTDELRRESSAALRTSWLVVSMTVLTMYLLLLALVHKGSKTIDRQRQELKKQVAQLTALIDLNDGLSAKVRRAAARTTALNERFLHRISADLHDGPGQDMGLALMKFEALADTCANCGLQCARTVEYDSIRVALQSALADLRVISAGLRLPEIDHLTIEEIAQRAVREYERKTGAQVPLMLPPARTDASLPVKIAVYRLLQEALANSFRHAGAVRQEVAMKEQAGLLFIRVSDRGAGFDTGQAIDHGRQGLACMRERVEILGGFFALRSGPGQGTVIAVRLPLLVPGTEHD